MDALQGQISQYQQQANQLASHADTLQAKLTILQLQRKKIEAQLQLTQKKYDLLNKKITSTEKDITATQTALGKVFATMWIDGNTTPLEMLASSQNISDFLDQQAYQSTMREKLDQTIHKVQQLKAQLVEQKNSVEVTLNLQKSQKNALLAKETQQQQLINDTKSQESAYRQLVNETKDRLQRYSEQQRNYFNKYMGSSGVVGDFSYSDWSGNKGCGGGYPYCSAQDTQVDPWDLYNRECVSYVAWSLSHRYHRYVAGFSGEGNAEQWPDSAVRFSGAERVDSPKAGDAVILPATDGFAPIGHAMIVESVDGADVHVSQYNFGGTGEYSTMTIGTGGVIFLRFPPR